VAAWPMRGTNKDAIKNTVIMIFLIFKHLPHRFLKILELDS